MLSPKEKILVSMLLKRAAEEFSNHGCNDLGKEIKAVMTREEWDSIIADWHKWNGDIECIQEDIEAKAYPQDWILMSMFADKILENK